MPRSKLPWLAIPFLLFFILSLSPKSTFAWLYSIISVEIEMEKETYQIGEPLTGKITVENKDPVKLSGVFNITLIHDEKVKSEFSTALKTIVPGKTEFSLQGFGIPDFSREVDSEGTWVIAILQQGLDPAFTASAKVYVSP